MQVVVVRKIDRLARKLEDYVVIKAILKKAGASLVSVVENIEDTASGRLIEGIHALMAEFYSANLGMQTKKGMIQRPAKVTGPEMAPLGYKNVQQNVGGRLLRAIEVDEKGAPLVKLGFELYATGDCSLPNSPRSSTNGDCAAGGTRGVPQARSTSRTSTRSSRPSSTKRRWSGTDWWPKASIRP